MSEVKIVDSLLIPSSENKTKIFEISVYSKVLSKCVFINSEQFYMNLSSVLVLSKYGQQLLDSFLKIHKDYKREEIIPFLLEELVLKDFLIDYQKTDLEKVRSVFSNSIIRNEIVLPMRACRTLYDKFHDSEFFSETDELNFKNTAELVSKTGNGTYQIGQFVIGEFGIHKTDEIRYIAPSLSVPLWHCSDTGCGKLHKVKLSRFDQNRENQWLAFQHFCFVEKKENDADLKWSALKWGLRTLPTDGKRYADLIYFISSCLSIDEKKSVLTRIFKSDYGKILGNIIKDKYPKFSNFIKDISILTSSEIDSICALASDNFLIQTIDEMILNKDISIPTSEIRKTRDKYIWRKNDGQTEASCLGLRSNIEPPILELTKLLWNAYEISGREEDLKWKLGNPKGVSYKHAFLERVNVDKPDNVVSIFVLSTKEIAEYVGKKLNIKFDKHNDGFFTDKILWKVGFNPNRFKHYYSELTDRGDKFKEIILNITELSEEKDREKIRAVGVNFFVAVEEFLEDLVSYNTWLIFSDHFKNRFVYSRGNALQSVRNHLGEQIVSGEEKHSWSVEGNNTFGTLLAYMNALSSKLLEMRSGQMLKKKRDEEELPHHLHYEHFIFPFLHENLWSDASTQSINMYTEEFDRLRVKLNQANISYIRNGIDHKRDDDAFPQLDEMLVCVTRVLEAFTSASNKKFIPKQYWLNKITDNQFTQTLHLNDFKQSESCLNLPLYVLNYPKINFNKPIIIAPFDFFDHPNTIMFFDVVEKSSYSHMWRNYPKRKS